MPIALSLRYLLDIEEGNHSDFFSLSADLKIHFYAAPNLADSVGGLVTLESQRSEGMFLLGGNSSLTTVSCNSF